MSISYDRAADAAYVGFSSDTSARQVQLDGSRILDTRPTGRAEPGFWPRRAGYDWLVDGLGSFGRLSDQAVTGSAIPLRSSSRRSAPAGG